MTEPRSPLDVLSGPRLERPSMDDFGMGDSCMASLRDLPFDERAGNVARTRVAAPDAGGRMRRAECRPGRPRRVARRDAGLTR